MVDDGLHRSHRMQGFPPEYYQPIPPHSPEDTSRGDIVDEENYSDTGSVATPLIEHSEGVITSVQEGFIHPTNPPLTNPLGPLLVRVNSLGEIVTEDYPRLPSRPFEEENMESGQPNQSEGFTTPVQTSGISDPSRTLVHPLWRTPSGHDIFDRLGISQPSFTTPLTPVVTSTITTSSNLFLGHPVGKIGNIVAISSQVSSGTGLVLPSQLNSAMTIAQTLPFQASSLRHLKISLEHSLLPREGQSLPPRYNALSG
jgi:hypothetical protein